MPLLQLLVDLDQPLTLEQCARDEIRLSERCVQPQSKPSIQQFLILVLQLNNKTFVIVLESEPMLLKSYQMVFEECFENNTKERIVNCILNKEGHRLWLQGPFNFLTRE